MSSIITPTIGRKVYFYEGPSTTTTPMACYDTKQPFDATVVYVWGPTCVNLRVTDHAGATHTRSSVPLRDPSGSDVQGAEYFATWMPYQVGQAKTVAPSA